MLLKKFCSIAVLLLALFGITPALAECTKVATLERIEGVVKVQPAGAAFPLRKLKLPHALCAGDEVFSLSGGQALISYAKGQVVLDANSRLKVRTDELIENLEGRLLFDIERQQQEVVQVHTPLIVIGVKGTRFLLEAGDAITSVALTQGLIDVQRKDGQEMALYQAKPASELNMQQYRQQLESQFEEFSRQQEQGFAAYKQRLQTEFAAYVQQVELAPGQQLTFGQEDEQPVVLQEQINSAQDNRQAELAKWLN